MSVTTEEQIKLAASLSTEALFYGLYSKCENLDVVRADFSEDGCSGMTVFDERRRLAVLSEAFFEMVLVATLARYNQGDRSDGWNTLTLQSMLDTVVKCSRESLMRAEQLRDRVLENGEKEPSVDW